MARLAAGAVDPELEEGKKLYELAKQGLGTDKPDPYTRHVTLSPSLTKAVYYAHSNLRNRSILQPWLFEAIGVMVGKEVGCSYLVRTHGRALEQLAGKSGAEDLLSKGSSAGFLKPNERSILQLVPRLVKNPASFADKDFDQLREAGYKDSEILDILAAVALFEMHNRIVVALDLKMVDRFRRYDFSDRRGHRG